MKRGEIYIANLEPTIGSEIKKKRPVLIVSNNANNAASATITIVPLTSNLKKIYPFEVLLKAENCRLSKDSKAQCHQIRTISKLRVTGSSAGLVSKEIMQKVDKAIRLHLAL